MTLQQKYDKALRALAMIADPGRMQALLAAANYYDPSSTPEANYKCSNSPAYLRAFASHTLDELKADEAPAMHSAPEIVEGLESARTTSPEYVDKIKDLGEPLFVIEDAHDGEARVLRGSSDDHIATLILRRSLRGNSWCVETAQDQYLTVNELGGLANVMAIWEERQR